METETLPAPKLAYEPQIVTSEKIEEIAKALVKAQSVMEPAKKNKTNPHLKAKYADLASVWEACRKPLTDNGIAVSQITVKAGADTLLVTLMLHNSGQWLRSTFPIRSNGKMQEIGSDLAYIRRYCLSALVGVAQDDDDGSANAAAVDRSEDGAEDEPRDRPARKSAAGKPAAKGEERKTAVMVPVDVKEEKGSDEEGPWTGWTIVSKAGNAVFTQDAAAAKIAQDAATLGNKISVDMVKTKSGWRAESVKKA